MTTAKVYTLFLSVLLLFISVYTNSSMNVSQSSKRQLTAKLIEQHIDKKLNAIDHETVSVALATGTAMACSQLGELALIDLELATKTTAFIADGACWLAYGSIELGSYFIAQISSATSEKQRQIKVNKVSPHIYDDGVSRITSVAVGDSYQITRTSAYLYDSYQIKPSNQYYQYAKTLEQHSNRPREKKAFQQIKVFIEEENRRMAEQLCFDPHSNSQHRRLPSSTVSYCLPRLPLRLQSALSQGNNTINLRRGNGFELNYLEHSPNMPWGGYGVQVSSGSYYIIDEHYSMLHTNGLVFDTVTGAIIRHGGYLTFSHPYIILNMYNFMSQPYIEQNYPGLVFAYINQYNIYDIFLGDLDNATLFPLTTDENICFFYLAISWLTEFYYHLPNYAQGNYEPMGRLLDHYTELYLSQPNNRLDRRQLIILHGISIILERLNINHLEDHVERFMQNLYTTPPLQQDYDSPLTTLEHLQPVSSNKDLWQLTLNTLKRISN